MACRKLWNHWATQCLQSNWTHTYICYIYKLNSFPWNKPIPEAWSLKPETSENRNEKMFLLVPESFRNLSLSWSTPKDFAGSRLFASNPYAQIEKHSRAIVREFVFIFRKRNQFIPKPSHFGLSRTWWILRNRTGEDTSTSPIQQYASAQWNRQT